MRRSATLVLISLLAVFSMPVSPTWAKTNKECNAEWKANKPALQAAKQKKKDFMIACKAGTESIPTAAPSPAQAPAPRATPAPQRSAPPAAQRSAAPAPRAAPTNAGQFTSEAQAKARCPSDTIVWVNTRSGVYHYAGTHNYGTTKSGAYMCEADTTTAGYRPAKNERHP